MTTVARRTFRSNPQRDALQTWTAIVDLLTQGNTGTARTELLAVGGVAASVIAEHAPKDAPIVVTCDGPRTRVYCLYDDDAIEGSDAWFIRPASDFTDGDLPCAKCGGTNLAKEEDVLDAKTLPKVQMPNRNGFVPAKFSDIPDEKKRGCKQGVCP